jgi:hypothetical protein
MTTYVVITKQENPHCAFFYRITHSSLFDEVSDNSISCEAIKIIIKDGEIADIKFVNDTEMMILLKTKGIVSFVLYLI